MIPSFYVDSRKLSKFLRENLRIRAELRKEKTFLSQDAGIFIRFPIYVPMDVLISTSLREFPSDVQADQIP